MQSRRGIKKGKKPAGEGSGADKGPSSQGSHLRPHWNAMRRELLVGGQVVKRFRVPAPNQEAVLAAFEEEGWPHRVYDPLPPEDEKDAKRRLHETIKRLNRHRLARIIRFHGDGTGEGVLWELVLDWR
jgi:hypothetical protein